LIPTAVDGTRNVLNAAKAAGIKRIVVTSSCAAVTPQSASVPPAAGVGQPFSEADWNMDSTTEKGPYRLSKRLAEEAVWEFAKTAPDTHVAAVNPSFVLGPPVLARASGESVGMMVRLLEGAMATGAPGSAFGAVDVRDLAEAHIQAMERDQANGKRFVLSTEDSYSPLDLAEFLRPKFGARFALPTSLKRAVRQRNRYTTRRAEEVLGVTLRPIQTTLVDMADFVLLQGLIDVGQAAKAKVSERSAKEKSAQADL